LRKPPGNKSPANPIIKLRPESVRYPLDHRFSLENGPHS
jgi:hypothetical protein